MDTPIPLCRLQPGALGTVARLDNAADLRRRLLDMGFVPGAQVVCVGRSPGDGLSAYRVCRATVAIRQQDAGQIWVIPYIPGEEGIGCETV